MSGDLNRPVVITMVAVRMMKASTNQVVNMVAMRDGGMAAIRTVNMLRVVPVRTVGAFIGIRGTDGKRVLVHMIAVRMMQMAVVKIIHMAVMFDSGVPATRAVNVSMVGVSCAGM
jgi:hypothetical protein